jgi:hypothetical protein
MDILKALLPIIVAFLAAVFPFAFETGRNLEYEYSLLVSYSFAILYPLVKIFVPFRPLIVPQQFIVILASILITFIPGSIFFLTDSCQCSDKGWLFWHIFHVIPIFIVVFSFTDLIIYWSKKTSRATGFLLHLSFLSSQLALVVYSTYFSGIAKAQGLFYGFLHGPIYDKLIIVDNGVIRDQYFNFIIALAMLFGSFAIRSVTHKKYNLYSALSSFLCIVSLGFVWDASAYDSHPNKRTEIHQILSQKHSSEGFTIHYAPNSLNANDIENIKNQIQFHIQDLENLYDLTTPSNIAVYLYPSSIDKKKIFGGYRTDVTDVLTPAIHISKSNFPHPTLRHELTHAVLANKGLLGLGFHPNMAITEGIAVALDVNERGFSLDQAAGYLVAEDKLSDPKEIFSPNFWLKSGARSYSVAGSLLLFIIEKYSITEALELFSGKSWGNVFGSDSEKILEHWRLHVLKNYDQKTQKLYTSRFFRSRGVLQQQCPHTKASLGLSSENQHLFHPSDYEVGQNQYSYLTEKFPNNRQFQLRNLRRLQINDKITTRSLTDFIRTPPKSTEDIYAMIYLADQFFRESKLNKSLEVINELKTIQKTRFLGRYISSQIELREKLLLGASTDDHIWYARLAKQRRAEKLPPIGTKWEYMLIYSLSRTQLPTIDYLSKFEPESQASDSLRYIWYKQMIYKSLEANRYDLSLDYIDKIQVAEQSKHTEFLKRYTIFLMDIDNAQN